MKNRLHHCHFSRGYFHWRIDSSSRGGHDWAVSSMNAFPRTDAILIRGSIVNEFKGSASCSRDHQCPAGLAVIDCAWQFFSQAIGALLHPVGGLPQRFLTINPPRPIHWRRKACDACMIFESVRQSPVTAQIVSAARPGALHFESDC